MLVIKKTNNGKQFVIAKIKKAGNAKQLGLTLLHSMVTT